MKSMFIVLTFLTALIGTELLRRYALARRIIDVPNSRSSHVVPTPRGGGVAIVVCFLLALSLWYATVGLDVVLFRAVVPGGLLVAVVGFWDDHSSLSARLRLLFHCVAAVWALWCLDGWPVLDLGFGMLAWGWLGTGVALVALVWATNLYNFMDGIDGIAGAQAVFVGGAGGVILCLSGGDGMPLWLLAAAAAGFLCLNWPPARIFMGDAGSGFLGFAFGVTALYATVSQLTSVWPWVILLGVFLVDTTLTLCRRALQGMRVTDAHRCHAYQWASRRTGAHRTVTLSVLAINLFLLAPAALAALFWTRWAVLLTVVCFAVLTALAWCFDAGVPEK